MFFIGGQYGHGSRGSVTWQPNNFEASNFHLLRKIHARVFNSGFVLKTNKRLMQNATGSY